MRGISIQSVSPRDKLIIYVEHERTEKEKIIHAHLQQM